MKVLDFFKNIFYYFFPKYPRIQLQQIESYSATCNWFYNYIYHYSYKQRYYATKSILRLRYAPIYTIEIREVHTNDVMCSKSSVSESESDKIISLINSLIKNT